MKIAVYTIAKNESSFVNRWVESCKDADFVLVVDTGSTDDTVDEVARQFKGIQYSSVSVSPWRFDDARNFSLMCIPADIDVCICLDMDEVLVDGWRKIVEDAWEDGLDRLRYNYVWSWAAPGVPGLTYHADKIHARHGLRWVNPVHEVLHKDTRLGPEKQKFINDTLIEHYPDLSKSRSQYLDLLALAVEERPNDDRNRHYYARELLSVGRYEEAIDGFLRHLGMPSARWKSERSASYRYIGDCNWALGNYKDAMFYFNMAIKEAPEEREPWVSLAQAHRALKEWERVKFCCESALKITERPNSYINQPWAWSDWPEVMLKEANEKL